ncbi:MAG: ImmA/IrrE family metallo-endopeptidase [Pyrinomonadaceae bacterium]
MRSLKDRLNPYELAKYARLRVVGFEEIAALSPETVEHLLGAGRNDWSGGACSMPLPDGSKLIILNPSHPPNRRRATLMEEVSHVFLGHKPSRLAIKNTDEKGSSRARDYDAKIEEQAYSVGAAALVPFGGLRELLREAKTSREIAAHYNVSNALAEFRLKTTGLWSAYIGEQSERQYSKG